MKTLFLLLFSAVSLCCLSQCKYGIVKSYAYRQPDYAGNIPDDDLHARPPVIYKVFLETGNRITPVWTKATIGNEHFNIIQTKVKTPFLVGLPENSQDSVILKTRKNNRLWQLNFEKVNNNKTENSGNSSIANAILLQGKWNKRSVNYKLSPVKALQPVLHM